MERRKAHDWPQDGISPFCLALSSPGPKQGRSHASSYYLFAHSYPPVRVPRHPCQQLGPHRRTLSPHQSSHLTQPVGRQVLLGPGAESVQDQEKQSAGPGHPIIAWTGQPRIAETGQLTVED